MPRSFVSHVYTNKRKKKINSIHQWYPGLCTRMWAMRVLNSGSYDQVVFMGTAGVNRWRRDRRKKTVHAVDQIYLFPTLCYHLCNGNYYNWCCVKFAALFEFLVETFFTKRQLENWPRCANHCWWPDSSRVPVKQVSVSLHPSIYLYRQIFVLY